MASIKIDGVDYETERMSEDAKKHLRSVQFADKEIERLEALLSLAKTARNAYAKVLSAALETYDARGNLN